MSPDPQQEIARIWVSFLPGALAGTARLRFSRKRPAGSTSYAALLSRGQIATMDDMEIVITTGQPVDGKSAYQLARDAGYGGTLTQWLASLVGATGASAYDLARAAGYGGTVTQWLASLIGAQGLSAYDVAVAAGFVGTQAQWLASLKASAKIADVALAQTATVAIAAGQRRLIIAVPASAGLTVGDAVLVTPTGAVPAGYSIGEAYVASPTSVSVNLTAPLLAIGASYSIPCRLSRLT